MADKAITIEVNLSECLHQVGHGCTLLLLHYLSKLVKWNASYRWIIVTLVLCLLAKRLDTGACVMLQVKLLSTALYATVVLLRSIKCPGMYFIYQASRYFIMDERRDKDCHVKLRMRMTNTSHMDGPWRQPTVAKRKGVTTLQLYSLLTLPTLYSHNWNYLESEYFDVFLYFWN